MKINSVIQLEDGKVHYQGELTQDEANLIVEVGMGILLAQGALPVLMERIKASKAEQESSGIIVQ